MFLKTGFPESLGAANVAKVALSTSKLINYSRYQRFGKPVFKVIEHLFNMYPETRPVQSKIPNYFSSWAHAAMPTFFFG